MQSSMEWRPLIARVTDDQEKGRHFEWRGKRFRQTTSNRRSTTQADLKHSLSSSLIDFAAKQQAAKNIVFEDVPLPQCKAIVLVGMKTRHAGESVKVDKRRSCTHGASPVSGLLHGGH